MPNLAVVVPVPLSGQHSLHLAQGLPDVLQGGQAAFLLTVNILESLPYAAEVIIDNTVRPLLYKNICMYHKQFTLYTVHRRL